MGRRIEASAVVPMGREETWDLLEGDEMRRVVELSDAIVAIENYRMRPDGTPRYVHVGRIGPGRVRFTADYSVFERPRRTEATILDSPFRGTYHVDYEAVPDGTRVRHRWDVEPKSPLFGLLLPLARPPHRAFVAAGPKNHRREGRQARRRAGTVGRNRFHMTRIHRTS